MDKHEEDDLKNKWRKQMENMTWSNIKEAQMEKHDMKNK